MRLRIEVSTSAVELPWRSVLVPGRGFVYDLLRDAAPSLGQRLHEDGWGPHGMAPFGFGAPVFPTAPRRRGAYAVGGDGFVELGSPLPEVLQAWAQALEGRRLIDWGGVALRVVGVGSVDPPKFDSGRAILRTRTPVVMKVPPSAAVERSTPWVLPVEPEFASCLQRNLQRKAESLGLDGQSVELRSISWVGAKRSFAVGDGSKPGAPVEVELGGDPDTLRAIWSWGLGQANSAGFGWIGMPR